MSLQTKTFSQIVSDQVNAIKGAASQVLNFTVGSIVLSFVESVGGVALWLQALILRVLEAARLTTSTGNDVDTFIEQFGLSRKAAVAADGEITFARTNTGSQAVIAVGTLVSASDGSQEFDVVVDTQNHDYSPSLNAYVLAVGISSINVPVKATVAGVSGNVSIGVVTIINSPIPGVDTVNNSAPFVNGADEESDEQVKAAFQLYFASLPRATLASLEYAISSLDLGLRYKIVELIDYNTQQQHLGYFYALIDNGTGTATTQEIDAVAASLEQYRGLTIAYEVKTPDVTNAAITVDVAVSSGADLATVKGEVENALSVYVENLGIGETLYFTRLYEVIYDASSFIVDVTNLLVNGTTADLTINPNKGVIKTSPAPIANVSFI